MNLYDQLLSTTDPLNTARQVIPEQPAHLAICWQEQAQWLLAALIDAFHATGADAQQLRACLFHWPMAQICTLLALTRYGHTFLQYPENHQLGILATLRTRLAHLDPLAVVQTARAEQPSGALH